jgi:hypothetical protein
MPSFEVTEIPVTRLKRGRKVDAGKLLREKADKIDRCEFAPDNSQIGNESRGLQSDTRWNGPLTLSQFGFIAAGIVPFAIIGSEMEASKQAPRANNQLLYMLLSRRYDLAAQLMINQFSRK